MKIGIAAPIEIKSLSEHLYDLKEEDYHLGTGGTAINNIIDGLIRLNHTVVVFTLDPNTFQKRVLHGPNLKIIIGHFRLSSRMKMLDFCRHEYLQIKNFIINDGGELDLVNAHWTYEYAIGTILSGKNHLITFRDHAPTILKITRHPYRISRLGMDYWVRMKGKHFSFNSIYLQDMWKKKVVGNVIPNPVNGSFIKAPKKFPSGRVKRICFVANGWDARKNPDTTIKGFIAACEMMPDLELHLFGRGYEAYNQKVGLLGKGQLSSNVKFRGPMLINELIDELSGFDLMIHTAIEESFGNNLVEAMALGIPVIAGKSSGAVPWVLDYGNAGVLVDVRDYKEVSNAILNILNDKVLYESISYKGFMNVQERFSQETVCKQYLAEFLKIIQE